MAPEMIASSIPSCKKCAFLIDHTSKTITSGTERKKLYAVSDIGFTEFRPLSVYTPQAIPAIVIRINPVNEGALTPGKTRYTNPVNAINLTSGANCYNINYYSSDSCSINLAAFNLNIDGNIFDENNKVSFNNGKLSFKGIISKNNQLLASESAFNTVDLEFISTNGSWNITNNFSAKNIKVENSSLYAANKSITITSIDISIGNENNVDFSGSVIEGLDFIDVSAGTEVNFDNSLILFSDANGNNIKSIKGGGNTFHNIQVQSAELSISGDNTFHKIFVDGLLTLTGDNTIDSLRLSDVSSLNLRENSTQTINNSFEATGSVSNLIEIAS